MLALRDRARRLADAHARRSSQSRRYRLGVKAAGWAAALVGFLLMLPPTVGGPTTWVVVSGNSMDGTYSNGDLVLTSRLLPHGVGDVVAYSFDNSALIIHRIVSGDPAQGWKTRGDAKPLEDPWLVTDGSIVGRAVLRVPFGGYVLMKARQPYVLAPVAGILVTLAMLMPAKDDPKRRRRVKEAASRVVLGPEPETVEPSRDLSGRDVAGVVSRYLDAGKGVQGGDDE